MDRSELSVSYLVRVWGNLSRYHIDDEATQVIFKNITTNTSVI